MHTPDAMHRFGALKSWLARGAIAAVAWAGLAIAGLAADAAPAAAPAAREPVRSIAAILALSPAEVDAKPEAVVRGVVTSARSPALVIQDGESPIFVAGFGRVEAEDGSAPTMQQGMIVEIEGTVVAAGYAPAISGRRTRVVGRGPVPPPVPADLSRLARGGDEGRWVTVQGVVHGFGERTAGHLEAIPMLMLDAGGWPLSISVHAGDRQFEPEGLVDAEVQVTGLASGMRNSRGQTVAPAIDVTDLDDIAILAPAPADPFAGEITPLDVLGRFVVQDRTGHRVHTEGIVSYAAPGLLYLQEGSTAVRSCPSFMPRRTTRHRSPPGQRRSTLKRRSTATGATTATCRKGASLPPGSSGRAIGRS
jgi:hypothetical protein